MVAATTRATKATEHPRSIRGATGGLEPRSPYDFHLAVLAARRLFKNEQPVRVLFLQDFASGKLAAEFAALDPSRPPWASKGEIVALPPSLLARVEEAGGKFTDKPKAVKDHDGEPQLTFKWPLARWRMQHEPDDERAILEEVENKREIDRVTDTLMRIERLNERLTIILETTVPAWKTAERIIRELERLWSEL